MNILVINCGSSSVKYQVLDPAKRSVLLAPLDDPLGHRLADSRNGHQVLLVGGVDVVTCGRLGTPAQELPGPVV